MKILHISETLDLPVDAATQTFAILGLRGSGKTNTAVDMLEEMLKIGQQIVWIDPVDVAWGIRSSRDGQASGFAITILGGEHGDVPLEGDSGKLIADFVIDNHASVILSLRHLSMNEQRQFATDFAERIYERKGKAEHRDALHIFVDECDEFVPQNIEQGKQRLFGAFDRLVRRGRSSGIGLTLISQRPQVVNKSVLSQCETLICHRILHKLDRKAVDEWVQAHDTEGRRDVFMQSLASLGRGEAWVWSPSWLDVFKKVQMRQRETFDSSATPVAGRQAVVPRQAAQVNLDALREKLKKTIDKAKENDPELLKRRIRELEAGSGPGEDELLAARNSVFVVRDQLTAALEREGQLRQGMSGIAHDLQALLDRVRNDYATPVLDAAGWRNFTSLKDDPVAKERLLDGESYIPQSKARPRLKPEHEWPKPDPPAINGDRKLSGTSLKVAQIAAAYARTGISRKLLAAMLGVTDGGSFSARLSEARSAGAIATVDGLVRATPEGAKIYRGRFKVPDTTAEVLAVWDHKLGAIHKRMLQALISHGQAMTRERLANAVQATDGGSFSARLSELRSTGLIVEPSRGLVAANKEALFL